MSARLSMWSQRQTADWMATAHCPKCDAMNKPGAKPTLALVGDGTGECAQCGEVWSLTPERPPAA